MSSKKIKAKVYYRGFNFLIEPTISYDRFGKVQQLGINRVQAAKMIRQYVKKKYNDEDIKLWVRSQSYSGGSSIHVYTSTELGKPIPKHLFNDISEFSDSLSAGKFDGMTDSYNLKEAIVNQIGTKLSMHTSFIFTENCAPYGSKPYKLSLEERAETFDKFKKLD